VTGRRFPSLRRYVEALGIEAYVVANSGALIREGLDGPILVRRLLPVPTALLVLELADEAGVEPVIHDGPDAEGRLVLRTASRSLPSMGRYLHGTSPEPIWVSSFRVERTPVQIGFTGGVSSMRALEAALLVELERRGAPASIARTEYPEEDLALLDVLALEATKARALEFLAAHLGIDLESTMAIGDNWNDLEMLERAGLGVIMGNAGAELRSRGFAETRTNDEWGVARAIEKYLLEKKGGESHPRSRYP
ncbi:MAG: HAD family hydrolase, partial [Vicinamibacteria bacterium]